MFLNSEVSGNLLVSPGDHSEAPYSDHVPQVSAKICQVTPNHQNDGYLYSPEVKRCHFQVGLLICKVTPKSPSSSPQPNEKCPLAVRTSDLQSGGLPRRHLKVYQLLSTVTDLILTGTDLILTRTDLILTKF